MPLVFAIVPRRCRSDLKEFRALSNAILEQRFARQQIPAVASRAPFRVNLLYRQTRRGSQENSG